jgi:ABC-type glycerol-3-phosphate transport system substrate-binding protein
MRKLLPILALLALLTGCEQPTVKTAVTCAGTGTVYFFTGRHGDQDVFPRLLTEFLTEHPDFKVVSVTPMDLDDYKRARKYMVIVSVPPTIPLPAVTEPTTTSGLPIEKQ